MHLIKKKSEILIQYIINKNELKINKRDMQINKQKKKVNYLTVCEKITG